MIVQGIGSKEAIEVAVPRGSHNARIAVEADGEDAVISLDANHLRVLAQLANAAADELDARAVGGVA